MPARTTPGHAGDHLKVSSRSGDAPLCGEILEVLGREHHEHYREAHGRRGVAVEAAADRPRRTGAQLRLVAVSHDRFPAWTETFRPRAGDHAG